MQVLSARLVPSEKRWNTSPAPKPPTGGALSPVNHTDAPKARPSPTWAELQASIRESGAGLVEAAPIAQATDFLEINWDGEPRSVPVAIVLTQVINHATEHRAQIMTMLTQLGIQPPDLDSWTYFDTRDGAV